MALSSESLAGPGYIILNCIRGLNIIGLLAIMAASVVLLVRTTTHSSLFFFDALTNVVSLCSAIFLMFSEMNLFNAYYARVMPLLSPDHGFVALSLALFVLGVDLLAKLNHDSDTRQALGLPFWRVVIAAGILCFILGIINFVASYVFRDSKQGITARQVRAHGAVAAHMALKSSNTSSPSSTRTPTTPLRTPVATDRSDFRRSLRLVAQPFQSTRERNDSTRHPDPILPSYQASTSPNISKPHPVSVHEPEAEEEDEPYPASPMSKYSRATFCSRKPGFPGFRFATSSRRRESEIPPPLPLSVRPLSVSAPLNVNPQFAHLIRPNHALHPARSNEGETYRFRN